MGSVYYLHSYTTDTDVVFSISSLTIRVNGDLIRKEDLLFPDALDSVYNKPSYYEIDCVNKNITKRFIRIIIDEFTQVTIDLPYYLLHPEISGLEEDLNTLYGVGNWDIVGETYNKHYLKKL